MLVTFTCVIKCIASLPVAVYVWCRTCRRLIVFVLCGCHGRACERREGLCELLICVRRVSVLFPVWNVAVCRICCVLHVWREGECFCMFIALVLSLVYIVQFHLVHIMLEFIFTILQLFYWHSYSRGIRQRSVLWVRVYGTLVLYL